MSNVDEEIVTYTPVATPSNPSSGVLLYHETGTDILCTRSENGVITELMGGPTGPVGNTGATGPSISNKYFDVYDNTGGQTTTGTITLNLDTVRVNSDNAVFSLANDIVTIDKRGAYLFLLRVSTEVTSSTRTNSQFWLEVSTNGGGTWNEIDGTRAHMYNRTSSQGRDTGHVSAIINVLVGNQYRIRLNRTSGGTIQTLDDASGMTILKINS